MGLEENWNQGKIPLMELFEKCTKKLDFGY
jgi:hypothetical protein